MKKISPVLLLFLLLGAGCGDDDSSVRTTVSVLITSPAAGSATTNSTVTVSGTAAVSPSGSITNVAVSLNSGPFLLASGTTNWTRTASLAQGSNTIVARAVSAGGLTNFSATNTIYYTAPDALYVAPGGSDTNGGYFPFAPLASLQTAVDRALAAGVTNVRLQAGTYTPGSGLNAPATKYGLVLNRIRDFTIEGGWDAGFSAATGYSTLDGQGLLSTVCVASNITNVRFANLVITGGNTTGYGGGMYLYQPMQCLLTNLVFHGGQADRGGGLFAEKPSKNRIHAVFSNNNAVVGGGIYFSFGGFNILNCHIIGNTVTSIPVQTCMGGGVFFYYSQDNTVHGTCSGNTAQYGGGFYLQGANNTTFAADCLIEGNTASVQAGGIATNNQITSLFWNGSWGAGNTPDNINIH